jgi:UDP-N-acetylmuramoylalanine--D-glutamate ligase
MIAAMASEYQARKILIVGAARSGIATARFLLDRGAIVTLTDSKPESALRGEIEGLRGGAGSERLKLEFGGHKPESFITNDLVVVSPGVPLSLPMFDESRRHGVKIIAEVELAFRHLKGKILAITGSNGKTTTTTLVAELLKGAGLKGTAAGNIGIPLISLAENSGDDDFYSVELSSFQLEGIEDFRPGVGAILNLTPDHLDRYADYDAYIAAKERIFRNQTPSDIAVLNADDARVASMGAHIRSTPAYFSRKKGLSEGVFAEGSRVVFQTTQARTTLFELGDIRLMGNHNVENVLAACTIAICAGADPSRLRRTIQEFRGVEHRLEFAGVVDGVRYFNDSKATNVDAAVKSLEAFPGRIHLIAGGKDKEGDFTVLRPLVEQRVVEVILIGEAAGKIREALRGTVGIRGAANLPEAVNMCRDAAVPGDVVLLAPACASFDMFEDYQHRGRVFKEAVASMGPRE